MEVQSQANDYDKNLKKQETTHTTLLKIDILILTTSMQNQNGIRQNDYYRYSRFCNKKIQKLRKFFKLTQGKKKFNKIEITPENVVDNKVLLIPILESERKWAKGMHYKQQITIAGKDIKRLRYNITKKFKKAALQSKKIFDLCKLVADTQTTLEAEAYSSLIEANYLIFKRNFNLALNLLKKTANIYEKISQLKDTIESITYKEKINLIKTQIRLCLYNLSTTKDIIFDEEELQNMNLEDDNLDLSEKLEEIKRTQSVPVKDGESVDIRYQGLIIPIKNEKLKMNFNKINEISAKIEAEQDLTKKINIFTDVFNVFDDIVKIIKKEKSEESGQNLDNFNKIYIKLLSYVHNIKLNKYVDKNLIYINNYSQDFLNLSNLTEMFDKDNVKLKVKPQEMIKLYDNLLEYQSQLINLEKENPDQSYVLYLNFKSKVYNIFKIYFISLFYLLNKKYEDVYTIMHHLLDKIREANENYEIQGLSSISTLKELKVHLEFLENLIRFVISKTFVKLAKDKSVQKSHSHLQSNQMIVDSEANSKKEKEKKIKFNGWMYDEMSENALSNDVLTEDNFEFLKENLKISYEDYIEGKDKMNYNNYSHIVQFPPNTTLLNPKPIIYDLTFQKLQYPDLEKKMKKDDKGLFSRAFGYFFSGNK